MRRRRRSRSTGRQPSTHRLEIPPCHGLRRSLGAQRRLRRMRPEKYFGRAAGRCNVRWNARRPGTAPHRSITMGCLLLLLACVLAVVSRCAANVRRLSYQQNLQRFFSPTVGESSAQKMCPASSSTSGAKFLLPLPGHVHRGLRMALREKQRTRSRRCLERAVTAGRAGAPTPQKSQNTREERREVELRV